MGNDNGATILLIVMIVSTFLVSTIKFATFIIGFNRETRYILSEMNRASDYKEYRYWRRELRCHYLCLIPFVSERNVMRLYHRLFHRAELSEKENRNDGIFHILAPSVIGACICVVCLCSVSWAWFTATTSMGTAKIQTATYAVSVTAKQGETEIPATTAANGITEFTLESGKEYYITITPTGTANSGYCIVNFEGKNYYTQQLAAASDAVTFTANASASGKMTVTPQWGTCTVTGQKIGNGENDLKEIGTKATAPDTTGSEKTTATPTEAPADEAAKSNSTN